MGLRGGIAAVALASTLVAFLLRGLWPHFASGIVGAPGDNLSFVWNVWWVAGALKAPATYTSLLFAPWGTTLLLHTHAVLASAIAEAVFGPRILAATNATITAHLFLNGACAFALAFRFTGRIGPSAVGAISYAWSPYIGVHLAGHYNLIGAWVLPLFALALLQALKKGGVAATLVGALTAAIAYIEYYYLVYAVCLGIVILLHRAVSLSWTPRKSPRWARFVTVSCATLLLADLVVIIVIAASGGETISIGPLSISARGVENPTALAGLLAIAIGTAIAFPQLHVSVTRAQLTQDLKRLAPALLIATAGVLPLVAPAIRLWRDGGYVTQTYFWRSAPAGVDLATLLMGNAHGALWSSVAQPAYGALGINAIEQTAWLGPAVMALAAVALVQGRHDARVQLWIAVAGLFGLWALGPRLQAFGRDLHVFLPAVLLRYMPIVSNARMPGRAMVVVYLAAAMLTAIGFDALEMRGRRALAWTLAVLLVLDFFPTAVETYRPDHPAIYETLAHAAGSGALCELPMGLRDGFGETGRMDMRVLWYQTIHGRAITGGFVARLDPRLVREYEQHPVLGVLLRLSSGVPLAAEQPLSAATAARLLRAGGIGYVMLNRETAPPDLIRYVESGIALRAIQNEEPRTLYEVADSAMASSGWPSR